MTVDADPGPVSPPPGGALRKGRRMLLTLAAIVGVVALAGWIGLAASFPLDLGRSWRLAFALIAGVGTEGAFWLCAAALGVTVFEARKRIWRRITGRG